jgi:hypothetical protein
MELRAWRGAKCKKRGVGGRSLAQNARSCLLPVCCALRERRRKKKMKKKKKKKKS